jgi:hypothetical protein
MASLPRMARPHYRKDSHHARAGGATALDEPIPLRDATASMNEADILIGGLVSDLFQCSNKPFQ